MVAQVLPLRCFLFLLPNYINVHAIIMQYVSYLDESEVLQQEYSQLTIFPSPYFQWVKKTCIKLPPGSTCEGGTFFKTLFRPILSIDILRQTILRVLTTHFPPKLTPVNYLTWLLSPYLFDLGPCDLTLACRHKADPFWALYCIRFCLNKPISTFTSMSRKFHINNLNL